jgi:hypothetical protein
MRADGTMLPLSKRRPRRLVFPRGEVLLLNVARDGCAGSARVLLAYATNGLHSGRACDASCPWPGQGAIRYPWYLAPRVARSSTALPLGTRSQPQSGGVSVKPATASIN